MMMPGQPAFRPAPEPVSRSAAWSKPEGDLPMSTSHVATNHGPASSEAPPLTAEADRSACVNVRAG
jgi:hypothetical protein